MSAIRPVILSGGAGTRLWPLSVPARPKQLQPLTGARTMLQETALRVADPVLFAPLWVIAGQGHAAAIEAQLGEIGHRPARLILEPAGRNTAAAIALAALEAEPAELLLVLPSDHVVRDVAAFRTAVRAGAALAAAGHLVTFGIRPDRPETGYGYVKRGGALSDGSFAVERFVEKPDRETAAGYLADGGYDWNGGIFLFRADRCLEELEAHAPDILAAVRAALAGAEREGARVRPDPDAFAQVRSESIDYAVMERSGRVAVVPVAMGWSDVGSWDALHELAEKDSAGVARQGDVIAIDSKHCLVRSDGPTVVTIGVENLIVVATGDAVLILPRGQSQRAREAAEAIGKRESGEQAG
jgi:mannose-1-phosphate guanylyltransferase